MDSHQKIGFRAVLVCCCFILQLNFANAQIYINELMASNSTTLADESGDFDDWIEIYNAGSSDVDLAGYYMTDDPTNPTLWQIPSTNAALTTVPAGGFLILWADKDLADGANHLNFKLSSNGETVLLTEPNGSTAVDEVAFGPQNTDVSYGLTEDGGDTFQTFPQPTPGVSNTDTTPTTYPATYIYQVNNNSDDAEQFSNGTMKLISSDLELTTDGANQQVVGIRFTDIDLQQGATVISAHLQFTSFQSTSGACNLTIAGEDSVNPGTFTETDYNISNRPLTSAAVNWSPADWPVSETSGADQKSPDLGAIIQELLDKPSWTAGNAMAFIISGTGTRTAYAHDVNGQFAVQLILEIALPAPTEPVVDLYINELAARGTDYADEAGDFEDWVELYNDGSEPINIGGLFLTDDDSNLYKWQIGASTIVAPGDYQILWTDSDPEEGPLHANFKLSGGGGTLSLVQVIDNAANIIDSVHFGNVPFKATYGRSTDGGSNWVTFGEITPDATNTDAGLWIAPPDFSLPNGAYNGTQSLTLSHPLSGVEIRYTTDGSDPDEFSTLYNNPISISSNQAVKAIAIKSGYTNSRPGLRSYLIDTPLNLPTLFLTSEPDNFFSDESGIYVVGTNGIPGYCSNSPRNWAQDTWERPANLTLLETDGTEAFNVDIGVKIGGACSRNFALKALNIYFREKEYGDDNLNYQMFKGRDHNNYFRLKLRNSGQDFVRMGFRDGLIHTLLWDAVDLDLQGFQPSVMYLNGDYWGLHNIRENFNDEYFETNYGIDKDELDLIKSPALGWQEIKKGDDVNYMALYDFIDNNDLSQTANYDYVNQRIDMNEFINYWIAMGYTANYDWPANNIIVWRERKTNAKWRWAVLDTDGSTANGLGNQADADFNTLAQITDPNSTSWPNHSNSTLFLRGLLENTYFRDEYIQRNCSFMELVFNTDRVNVMTDSIKNMVLPEIDSHIDRWGYDNAMGGDVWSWESWVDAFKDFFQDRPDYFRGFMNDHFNLNGTYELSVIYDADTGGDVFVNSNLMAIPYDYVGTYFKDIPMRVTAVAKPGFTFSHWLETGETNPVINFISDENTTLTPIFTEGSISVNLGPDQSICEGESISLNGTAPGCTDCTYLWEDGSTTAIRNVSPATNSTYSVTVTNGSGQTVSDDILVTVSSIPNGSLDATDVSCEGQADGFIDLTVNSGTAPFEYDWSNQSSTQDIDNLYPGNYSVTITDSNDCSTTASAFINEPPPLLFGQVDPVTNVSCAGENDGAIDVLVSEGTPPYTFEWSNGATSEDLTDLAPGNYTLTITEANDCETVVSYIVEGPDAIDLDASINDIDCAGDGNGSINLSIDGGTEPYTHVWSNGSTTENIFNLDGGTYIVTVTDANLCESIETFEVEEPTALSASESSTPLACFNDNNASIQLTVNGGTEPYDFDWSNGATSQNIDNLSGGTYSVTITDDNDCEIIISDIEIATPDPIFSNSSGEEISCFGEADGMISTNAEGGSGNLTYLWSNGATTTSISNLDADTYTLTITDSEGCELVESFTLTEPESINSGATINNIACAGDANGSIDLNVSGGNGSYQFAWSNGATSEDLDDLNAGIYILTITDGNNCELQETFEITEPPVLSATPSISPLDCYGDNDASIDLDVSGGTAPYTYIWSTGATTQNLNNLGGGTFSVTITDDVGCEFIESNIIIDTPDELVSNIIVNPIFCAGEENGSIVTNASGGDATYSYQWSNGATTANLFNLSAGTYMLTLTDGAGCEIIESAIISSPAELSSSFESAPISCHDYTDSYINISIDGGVEPYSFLWNTGDTVEDLYNLGAGFYEVTVTDANQCIYTEAFTITEPDELDEQATIIAVSCNGVNNGAIQTTPSGGTAPYTYNWNTGATTQNISDLTTGTYILTLSDANGCQSIHPYVVGEVDGLFIDFVSASISCFGASDASLTANVSGGTGVYSFSWSTGAGTASIDNLSPGNYQLTVIDNGNCEAVESFEIIAPPPLNPTSVLTMASCGNENGSVSILAEGGTPPYSYEWNTGATTSSISNLGAGNYSVTVYDANDCAFILNENIIATPGITVIAAEQGTSCFGTTDGSISLTPEGGNGVYQFAWSNGSSEINLENVGAGIYTVTVTDTEGCESIYTGEVTQPELITEQATLQNISCYAGMDGAIALNTNGGTAPYMYNWSNGATSQDLDNLSAGEYLVTINDVNGCAHLDSFVISEPDSVSFDLLETMVSCFEGNDGAVDLIMLGGGTEPYTYNWSTGVTSQNIGNLSAGLYELTITDANDCLSFGSINIEQPSQINLDATLTNPSGANNDGMIFIDVSGGVAPYIYLWNTGATTPTITGLTSGSYTVSVTDANGCVYVATYILQTSGLESIEGVFAFELYPNPTSGKFMIEIESSRFVDGLIVMYDILGRSYLDDSVSGNSISLPIDMEAEAAGVYFVKLVVGDEVMVRKVVIGE